MLHILRVLTLRAPFYFLLVSDAVIIAIDTALAIGARRGLIIEMNVAFLANLRSSADVHPPFEHDRSCCLQALSRESMGFTDQSTLESFAAYGLPPVQLGPQ
jgi:hypothetical protein